MAHPSPTANCTAANFTKVMVSLPVTIQTPPKTVT